MLSFQQFCESKDKDNDTRSIKAIVDLADAIRKVFKKYSRTTRRRAWNKITSKGGLREVDKLLVTPTRSLNTFRSLSETTDFESWLENPCNNS